MRERDTVVVLSVYLFICNTLILEKSYDLQFDLTHDN